MKYTNKQIAEMQRMKKDGYTQYEIAEKFCTTRQLVRKLLKFNV